jgi:hypothetical protein
MFKTAMPAYEPPAVSPFADVATGQPFYKEMAWLAEQRTSAGWTEPSYAHETYTDGPTKPLRSRWLSAGNSRSLIPSGAGTPSWFRFCRRCSSLRRTDAPREL